MCCMEPLDPDALILVIPSSFHFFPGSLVGNKSSNDIALWLWRIFSLFPLDLRRVVALITEESKFHNEPLRCISRRMKQSSFLAYQTIYPRITKGTCVAYWSWEAVWCHVCCGCIPAPISGWFA